MAGRFAGDPLERKLSRALGRAISDFSMLRDGDRLLVALSGGKDSHTLLYLLRALRRRAPIRFELEVVTIDQGHAGFSAEPLRALTRREGDSFTLVREDTRSVVVEKVPEGETYCSLCSRFRRAILYRVASELGCNKIALGHHREDVLVTFLLNLHFAGKLATMPPVLRSDDGRHTVIRPLVYSAEDDIARFARERGFPIVPCDLCGRQPDLERARCARSLDALERERPGTKAVMLAALANVVPSHLLDPRLRQPRTGSDPCSLPAGALVRT